MYARLLKSRANIGARNRAIGINFNKEEEGEIMRKLDIGTKRFTEVQALDEPGEGGACHEYEICGVAEHSGDIRAPVMFANVSFQNGPIKEHGVNGCHNEDLLAIVIDRLQHFQAGAFKCRENALALTRLEGCMHWLNHRTMERVKRGVEGTNQL